jgi:hypothetical protein
LRGERTNESERRQAGRREHEAIVATATWRLGDGDVRRPDTSVDSGSDVVLRAAAEC